MKKNKLFIWFSCLLVSFIMFISVGVSVNANSALGESPLTTSDYIYNDDYEKYYSKEQPYVMNYYYYSVQSSNNTNILNSYLYSDDGNSTIFTNGISFNYVYDVIYSDDVLYNSCNISSGDDGRMGAPFIIGYNEPLYVRVDDFYLDGHTLIFNDISLPLNVYVKYNIDYVIKRDLESPYEVNNYTYDGFYIDSLYTDDYVVFNLPLLWERAFDLESPYEVNNTLIRINYLYYIFNIDWTDYVDGDNWSIDYVFPVLDRVNYDLNRDLINIWDDYDLTLNPINIDLGNSLLNSVNSFMQFQILPNFSLFNLLLVVVAVPLLIYILKLFLGG